MEQEQEGTGGGSNTLKMINGIIQDYKQISNLKESLIGLILVQTVKEQGLVVQVLEQGMTDKEFLKEDLEV